MKRLLWVVGLVGLLGADGPIDKAEFDCWEAFNSIATCCPSGGAWEQIDCQQSRGCGEHAPEIPDCLSVEIRAMSCDQILAAGYCDRRNFAVCQ